MAACWRQSGGSVAPPHPRDNGAPIGRPSGVGTRKPFLTEIGTPAIRGPGRRGPTRGSRAGGPPTEGRAARILTVGKSRGWAGENPSPSKDICQLLRLVSGYWGQGRSPQSGAGRIPVPTPPPASSPLGVEGPLPSPHPTLHTPRSCPSLTPLRTESHPRAILLRDPVRASPPLPSIQTHTPKTYV